MTYCTNYLYRLSFFLIKKIKVIFSPSIQQILVKIKISNKIMKYNISYCKCNQTIIAAVKQNNKNLSR